MRLSHIEARLEQQLALMGVIKNAYDNLVNVNFQHITLQRIQTRLTALKDDWEKFSLVHNAIEIAVQELSSENKLYIHNHPYFTENVFAATHECYLESLERMSLLSSPDHGAIPRASSTQSVSQNQSSVPSCFHQARLPRIDLPKFNGTPSDWLSFKDLFHSLVLANPTLTSVEKLQYLKTSLVGSAAHLLKNTTLTADNFHKAWEALISFYENKRLLVNSALHSLLSLKHMSRESAVEMEQLYTTIMQIYRSLETLHRPVAMWDDFLVFIAVQRLDAESVKAWEHHLGSSKEPPTWTQFSDFLITRLLSLQAFEKSRPRKVGTPSHSSAVKAHYQGKTTNFVSKTSVKCGICSENHTVSSCPKFNSKSIEQRLSLITKHRLCYNCLGSHKVTVCRVTTRCRKCGRRHHTTIHRDTSTSTKANMSKAEPAETTETTSKPSSSQVLHASVVNASPMASVLLATAMVVIQASNKITSSARALIDQGSEVSLVSERLVQRLRLHRTPSSIPLVGIGAQSTSKTKGMVTFTMISHFNSNINVSVSAHVLPKLTASIPSMRLEPHSWPHLQGLQLADPHFSSPGAIDIILGADIYTHIIEEGIIKGPTHSPIAQSTLFGWIISGPIGRGQQSYTVQTYHVSIKEDLYNLLQRFWEWEETPTFPTSTLSEEEQECEKHFLSTVSRDSTGRYKVRLPFKQSPDKLGDSKSKAIRMLTRLRNRFLSDQRYKDMYSDFITEYMNLQHMVPLPDSLSEQLHSYYLPHHGVLRESSLSTKLRVVFNGSSQTSSGFSLNDLLHTGAKLQTNIIDVLIWFRQFCYVFSSDMEKMYRQIQVHSDDWKYQQILWMDDSKRLKAYQLTTVTYGLVCAPFLALRTILQLIQEEGTNFPRAVPLLTKGRYVDDVFRGADSIEEAQAIVTQTTQLCMASGFLLKKWISNDNTILDPIPPADRINMSSIPIKEEMSVHSLGLSWQPSSDTFHFKWQVSTNKPATKRTILSTIARLFDPLGLVSPVIITAKILLQELWTIKLDWDTLIPFDVATKWNEFLGHLQNTPSLTFPRWLGFKSTCRLELHGFCDASQQAIAAAVYSRSTSNEKIVFSQLICSKTKVAPLKRQTIPRLELAGAVLLTKLLAHVIQVLDHKGIRIYLWTDSLITYTWINNHPSRWKDFIHNRVCFIQETLPQAQWGFVPGSENPADLATRGLTPLQLSHLSAWWTGPSWLSKSPQHWPQKPQVNPLKETLEERAVKVSVQTKAPEPWDLLRRYSNLSRLLRITAICKRVISQLRREPNSSLLNPITTTELDSAKQYWVQAVQHYAFHHELQIIEGGTALPKTYPLVRLTPFLDANGLLRVGGRLQASSLSMNAKHPVILPKDSPFTTLVIADAHWRTLHGGTQITLSFIRNDFWIIGGRVPIKSFILKCIRCTRYRQKRAQQLMGQLPPEKLTPSRSFLNSGVDYAGPFTLKTWRGKNARTYKAYIVLFVCHSTSAVHIELVTDYTTEAFIAAYKRFTGRRGICSTLMSDCGTNLKGADAELQRLFSSSSKEFGHMASLLAQDGTQWKFIPPSAPHFGGKWEAGVKSVKYHLNRVVGETAMTYEEMTTLLVQIEAILNSRPLCPLSDDPEDLHALTPGHFIMGCAPSVIPEPKLDSVKTSRLSRWQLIRQMLDCFWSRWSTACNGTMQFINGISLQNPSRRALWSWLLTSDTPLPNGRWDEFYRYTQAKTDLLELLQFELKPLFSSDQ